MLKLVVLINQIYDNKKFAAISFASTPFSDNLSLFYILHKRSNLFGIGLEG
jgi:hypothetical protein